jgi:hypothetical protein
LVTGANAASDAMTPDQAGFEQTLLEIAQTSMMVLPQWSIMQATRVSIASSNRPGCGATKSTFAFGVHALRR